jgi:hypothetical protein
MHKVVIVKFQGLLCMQFRALGVRTAVPFKNVVMGRPVKLPRNAVT